MVESNCNKQKLEIYLSLVLILSGFTNSSLLHIIKHCIILKRHGILLQRFLMQFLVLKIKNQQFNSNKNTELINLIKSHNGTIK